MSRSRLTQTVVVAAVLALLAMAPVASAKSRAVVLVSGTAATTPFTTPEKACGTGYSAGNTWAYLRDYLVARGYAVYTAPASVGGTKVVETTDAYAGPFGDCPRQLPATMTINAIGSVDQSGAATARFIRHLHDRYGVTSVDIVGHSLGALIGRATIREVRYNRVPVRVRSYTTLGGPWGGAMPADPTVPGKPLSACDGFPICEGFLKSLQQIPGIDMLVTLLRPDNTLVWGSYQAGVLDGIPVTMIAGSYFTKPGGAPRKWPNDGVIQVQSALGAKVPNAVVPHRTCFTFPLTHSLFISQAIGAADDTALTWNPEVGATMARAFDDAGAALKGKNRVGCPAVPKG